MSLDRFWVIAVDGPAASGKSSVSRALAQRLGYVYVNTGAMYRAVTWLALRKGVVLSDAAAVERLLGDSRLEAGIEDGQSSFLVDGVDPGEALVSHEVNAGVSKIATLSCVRNRLVAMQRQYGLRCHSVMEGRDIGSVVFPETPAKFYVDASVEVRAARRLGQGLNDPVALRDAMDSARKSSPLTVPAGAWVIDSSDMSVAQVVAEMLRLLQPLGILPRAV
jgi:cytidylate kinase